MGNNIRRQEQVRLQFLSTLAVKCGELARQLVSVAGGAAAKLHEHLAVCSAPRRQ